MNKNSKKIGILTHYYQNKNIGALLQAYALPTLLKNKGQQVEQISFDFYYYDADAIQLRQELFPKKPRKITFLKLIKYPFRRIQNFLIERQNKKIIPQIKIQNAVFSEFESFTPHSKEKYNTTNISKANKNYDIFITGSDQVFATYLLPLNAYYGEFATPDKKVLSYAASSNVKQFEPKVEDLFIKKLQRLNPISVREKTLKDYIQNITDKKAELVLDSTFLLSPQEWLKIANPNPVPQKPYIFCYFLGGKSAWQRQVAQAYADKYACQVIHLPYIMRNFRPADKYLKGQGLYNVGPREFVSLINNAKCVFTDSFHGLAFSINFGKNFYVFNRDDESGANSMNARITDTLEMLGLTSRHITNKNAKLDNKQIDFTNAHKILEREKQQSINWLLNALKD